MSIGGEGVLGDDQWGGLAPRGVAALGRGYLGIARIVGVGLADGEIHGLGVGRKGASTLVQLAIQFGVDSLGLRPLAFVVLLREEDVGVLGTGDATQLVALGLVARAAEIELAIVVARQHGGVLRAARVKEFLLLHRIARILGLGLPFRCHAGRLETAFQQGVVGHGVLQGEKGLFSFFIGPVFQLQTSEVQQGCRVNLLIANGIVVGRDSLLGIVDATIAVGHLEGPLSTQGLFLGFGLRVGLLVLSSGIIVFAQSVELVALLHGRIGSTSLDEETDDDCDYDRKMFAHTGL